MRLVVFGLSVSSAWGNGHATLWRGILRALASAGHDVAFFERDTPYYAAHRDMAAGDGWELCVYPTWDAVRPRVRAALARADAAIVTSYQADAPDAIEAVLGSRALHVFYDLDTPVTLDALDRGVRAPYLPERGLGDFDLVLSYTGGGALDALRARLGARAVAALYGSADVDVHRPAPAAEAWRCDLSYLGTYAPDRQEAVERLFLSTAARAAPSARFLLAGAMYPPAMTTPANVAVLPHVAPPDHPRFYGSSRATLNVTRAAMARMGHCPSARLFEAAACGAPLVTDAWEGLDRFFAPGEEVLVAEGTEDVERALRDDGLLRGAAARARARVLAEHRADHRAAELVSLLRSIP